MFVALVGELTPECVFYLSSHCLICIFHHVKQIEDNEGLGDEGRSCAPHTERSICFQCNTKDLLSENPHWLCIRDGWSSSTDGLSEHPQCAD